MGDEIESATQQAPQPVRHSIKFFSLYSILYNSDVVRLSSNSVEAGGKDAFIAGRGTSIMDLIKSWRFWIGLVITIVCLALAFQGIQLDKLAQSFGQFNWVWLPVLILTFLASYFGRAFRWQALFYPSRPRWTRVLSTLNVGYFLSNITPARIGDLARAYLLGTLENIPVARALSTVVVERTLDGLTVVVFLIVLLPFIPNLPPEFVNGGLVLGATGIGLLVLLAVVSLQHERGVAFLRKLASPFPFLQREGLWRFVGNLIQGFAVLRSPRPLLIASAWSLEVWLVASFLSWLVMFSMGLQLPFVAGVLIQVLTALAVTVAASPGQLGVFHFTAVLVLRLFGVDPNQALAYAFVLHGLTYLLLMFLGLGSLWREGLDLTRLQQVSAMRENVGP
jgi:uncharacterized protein (TIRG00374 family)